MLTACNVVMPFFSLAPVTARWAGNQSGGVVGRGAIRTLSRGGLAGALFFYPTMGMGWDGMARSHEISFWGGLVMMRWSGDWVVKWGSGECSGF